MFLLPLASLQLLPILGCTLQTEPGPSSTLGELVTQGLAPELTLALSISLLCPCRALPWSGCSGLVLA